jgi:hypothetical protein
MAEYYAQPVEYPNPPPQPDGRVEPRPAGVPAHSHEGTDVAIRPLVILGIGLVIFLVATCVFLVFVFNLFSFVEQKDTAAGTGIKDAQFDRPVEAPVLQGVPGYHQNIPAKDMEEFRHENERLLTTYSTAKDGAARIPVAKAIEVAIEKAMFKTATGPSTAPAGGVDPVGISPAKEDAAKPKAD